MIFDDKKFCATKIKQARKKVKLTQEELAEKIGISAKAIEKHLANLKADGRIERIGPAKGGYWKVK